MYWFIYNFMINQIEVGLTFYFMNAFFVKKSIEKKWIASAVVAQGLVFQFSDSLFGAYQEFGIILILGLSWILYKIIFESGWLRLLMFLLIYLMVIGSVEVLTYGLITFFLQVQPSVMGQNTVYRVVGGLLSRCLVFIAIRFIAKRHVVHEHLRKVYIYEFILILLSDLTFFIIVLSVYQDDILVESNALGILSVSAFLIIFTMLIMKVIDEIIRYSQKEVQWDLMEREYERQINYIHSLDELTYKLKAQRHDFNHHIGCLYGLIEQNEFIEAKIYLKDLIRSMQKLNDILKIDNPVIGALINYKLSMAEEKNIKITTDINIPKVMPFEAIDISIILGNAIDNAIEGCEGAENKQIAIQMVMEKQHLFIKIENSVASHMSVRTVDVSTNHFKTTKPDLENHGFGLTNIQYAVEKYSGLMKYETKEDQFILNIALKT